MQNYQNNNHSSARFSKKLIALGLAAASLPAIAQVFRPASANGREAATNSTSSMDSTTCTFKEAVTKERKALFCTLAPIAASQRDKSYILPILEETLRFRERNPSSTSEAVSRHMLSYLRTYKNIVDNAEGPVFNNSVIAEAANNIASSFGDPRIGVPMSVLNELDKALSGYRDANEGQAIRIERQRELAILHKDFTESRIAPEQRWKSVFEQAEKDPVLKDVIYPIVTRQLDLNPSDSNQMYSTSPELKAFAAMQPQNLTAQVPAGMNPTFYQRQFIEQTVNGVTRLITREVIEANNSLKKSAKKEKNENNFEANKTRIENTHQVISFTSQLVREFGGEGMEDTANHLNAAGDAYLQVAKAINKYGGKTDAISQGMLSMNYVQAGMAVLQALRNTPSAEEIIMEQITQMHKEILGELKEIRQEIGALDSKLDRQLAISLDCFNELFQILGDMSADVSNIKSGVNDLHERMDRLEVKLRNFHNDLDDKVKDGFLREWRSLINRANNHDRNSTRVLTDVEVDTIFQDLVMWVTEFSKHSYANGSDASSLESHTSAEAVRRLKGIGLIHSLNFIAHSAVFYGNTDILGMETEFGDTEVLIESAMTFVDYYDRHPEHQGLLKRRSVELVIAELEKVNEALKNIKTKTDTNGTVIREEFFTNLLDSYKREMNALSSKLSEERKRIDDKYLAGWDSQSNQYARNANLRGIPTSVSEMQVDSKGKNIGHNFDDLYLKGIAEALIPDEIKRLLEMKRASGQEMPTMTFSYVPSWTKQEVKVIPHAIVNKQAEVSYPWGGVVVPAKINYSVTNEKLHTSKVNVRLLITLEGYGNIVDHNYTASGDYVMKRELIEAKKIRYERNSFTGNSDITGDPTLNNDNYVATIKLRYPGAIILELSNMGMVKVPGAKKPVQIQVYMDYKNKGGKTTFKEAFDNSKQAVQSSNASVWKVHSNLTPAISKAKNEIIQQRELINKLFNEEITRLFISDARGIGFDRGLMDLAATVSQVRQNIENANAAKELLEAYIRIGFPSIFTNYPEFELSLSGENQLLDGEIIAGKLNEDGVTMDIVFNAEKGMIKIREEQLRTFLNKIIKEQIAEGVREENFATIDSLIKSLNDILKNIEE